MPRDAVHEPPAAPQPAGTGAGAAPLGALDALLAAVLTVVFGALYASNLQRWLWNDGFFVAEKLEWNESGLWPHPAYLPLARVLNRLLPGPGPYEGLFATSWMPAALGLGVVYLLARGAGRSPAASGLAAALLGLTPVHWFFATTIEVHALHFWGVATAALVAQRAPWGRRAVAVALAVVSFALVPLTHLLAPLLGPGWLVWCETWAKRAGAPLGAKRVVFVLAPLFVVVGLGAFALTSLFYWKDSVVGGIRGTAGQIAEHMQPSALVWWRDDVWLPAQLYLVAALLGGWWLWRRERASALVLVALVVPLLVFTAWWAVPNEGGYLLGATPFLALAVAAGADALRRRLGVLALAVVALASAVPLGLSAWEKGNAWRAVHAEQLRDERAEQVRLVLGDEGVLVAFDTWKQPIGLDLVGIRERQLIKTVEGAFRDAVGPEDLGSWLAYDLKLFAEAHPEGVALELLYRDLGRVNAVLRPYTDSLERELAKHVVLEEFPHPRWPMARMKPRP